MSEKGVTAGEIVQATKLLVTRRPMDDVGVALIAAALPERLPRPPGSVFAQGHPDTSWDRMLVARILDQVACGETMTAIFAEPGMPNRATWTHWVKRVPELAHLYELAKKHSGSALFDEALGLARMAASGAIKDPVHMQGVKLGVETAKWAAWRRSPEEFGDRPPMAPALQITIVTDLPLSTQGRVNGPALAEMAEALDMEEGDGVYVVRGPAPPGLDEPTNAADGAADSEPEQEQAPTPAAVARRGRAFEEVIRVIEEAGQEADGGQDAGDRDPSGGAG